MKHFNNLFFAIDQTTSTNEKINALTRYFAIAPEKDMLWSIYLLSGKKVPRVINTALLRASATSLSGLPLWLFEESYHIVGDLAETIALCLPEPTTEKDYTLSETMDFLNGLPALLDAEKQKAIRSRWMESSKNERFLLNKLITGNFRVGVSKQLVIKAIAKHLGVQQNEVAHRLMRSWHPEKDRLNPLFLSEQDEAKSYEPYPFFLAYQLDQDPETLGPASDWVVERKFDGIRGQIIVRNQALYIWSRGEDLLTDKFPEFIPLAEQLPDGTVLDGEIIPQKDGVLLPFALMQTRIGRKNLSKKILDAVPLIMVCYDLLEMNGEDIRNSPLAERRSMLSNMLEALPSGMPLRLSEDLACKTWEEVKDARNEARNVNSEGVMLKHKESIYETGRRRGNWWKWKIDPYTIDGVLIYAQRGHGRRANLYTDYTFAVWDGGQLVPFAKAYSGLTDKELLAVDSWVKRNTVDKFGPVRSVKAELVFELAFEGISASPRHKSGIALRFPRIVRWRKDKSAEEANTKADLMALLEVSNSI